MGLLKKILDHDPSICLSSIAFWLASLPSGSVRYKNGLDPRLLTISFARQTVVCNSRKPFRVDAVFGVPSVRFAVLCVPESLKKTVVSK